MGFKLVSARLTETMLGVVGGCGSSVGVWDHEGSCRGSSLDTGLQPTKIQGFKTNFVLRAGG